MTKKYESLINKIRAGSVAGGTLELTQEFLKEASEMLSDIVKLMANKGGNHISSSFDAQVSGEVISVVSEFYVVIQNVGRAPADYKQGTRRPPVQDMIRLIEAGGFTIQNGMSKIQAAYILSQAIWKKGTKAKNFVKPSFNKFYTEIDSLIEKYVSKVFPDNDIATEVIQ